MELSESLFMEITGVRPSTPIYDAGPNKRGHTRVTFGARARIFPLMESAAGCGSPVMVRDLSRSGVGFQLYDEMSVGDEFVLHLTKQTGESVNLQCMVQRCEPGGTGLVQFVVGATFELVLTEAQWHEPKITQNAERGTLHPQLAMAAPAVVSTPDPESAKIRGRLSSMSSKLADRLARSPAAEPAIAETPLVLTAAPVLPAETLLRARSTLFGPSTVEVQVPHPAAAVPAMPIEAPSPMLEVAPIATPIPAAEAAIKASDVIESQPEIALSPTAEIVPAIEATTIAITTPAVETAIEVPAGIESQPEIAASSAEKNVHAIEVTQTVVVEQLATPAVEVSSVVLAEPLVASLDAKPESEQIVAPIVEVPAIIESSLPAAVEVIAEPVATVTEAEATPMAAPIEQVVTQRDAELVPAAAAAEERMEVIPPAVVEIPQAAEPVAEQEAAAAIAPSPKAEPTKPMPAVEVPVAAAIVAHPPMQHSASRMMAAAPAAVPSMAAAQDGSSSMVVIVVPSSLFSNGQKTISISAGGMDVTVSVTSQASATVYQKPAAMNPAFDSTFDLLSEVIDPTAELLATA